MDIHLPEAARRARPPAAVLSQPSYSVPQLDPFVVRHLDAAGIARAPERETAGPGALARRIGRWLSAATSAGLLAAAVFTPSPAAAQTTLLNVSYDPTRELYREFNEAFNAHWQAQGHEPLDLQASHGGSGSQARAVIDGLDAQVLTLALSADIDAVAAATGKVPADWQTKLPNNSAPYTSTIVFIVRARNPKNIQDWDDLIREDVQVITPNPKTSGVARWNYLAAWAYAAEAFDGDEAKIRDFVAKIYQNVPVLDTGARAATTTFVQRGIGDVLLNWENEAFLALREFGTDQFEIVLPSISILAEPTVALVEGNLHTDEQRAAATAYLDYLYSPEGQAIAFKNFYRGIDPSKADPADVERFPDLVRVPIGDFGGWPKVQPEHFGDGGVFDQIYVAK
jgi:sulfate transport system substrate-binding protein